MLRQGHFFKPRAHVKSGDILSRHLVIKDKYHRDKSFHDGRVAVAAKRNSPTRPCAITIHT